MSTIQFVTPQGEAHTLEAEPGTSVMEIAVQDGVPGIVAECGGAGACATCHIYIDPEYADRVGPPGDLEDDMLDGTMAERRNTSRLACQIEFHHGLDGLRIEIAPEQS
ncbi:(2Fe-2S)-binding protein [Rhodococcus sp. ACS1]|uniref:2Fe-2S iron-sulfur cluster-binding protein n=1 Tax=Rhodococcus TaxID=1827 RepID=UPI000BB12C3A|nr:2Fe-2S iron-sulfur cluster-binding protein [Rhodococcus sp. ACS1]PBC36631.1 (2Fe-2S)-binding protein [Rhodococcus sp. ACS1]